MSTRTGTPYTQARARRRPPCPPADPEAHAATIRHAQLIGSRIRQARERQGLSQHQLAQMLDIKRGNFISRWENGHRAPGPLALERLADALGQPIHFFYGSDTRPITTASLDAAEALAVIAELQDALTAATDRLRELGVDRA